MMSITQEYQLLRTVLHEIPREELEDYAAACGMMINQVAKSISPDTDKFGISVDRFAPDEEMQRLTDATKLIQNRVTRLFVERC